MCFPTRVAQGAERKKESQSGPSESQEGSQQPPLKGGQRGPRWQIGTSPPRGGRDHRTGRVFNGTTRAACAQCQKKGRRTLGLLRGRDVFSEGRALRKSLDESLIRHWAPNCSTFSRARERPIAGAAFSPKPLRDDDNPRGIPSVVLELPPSKRRRLDLDTQMADMAAEDCIASHLAGRYFSLEHPKNSIARRLDSWKELESLQGVFSTEYHACMFESCRRRKSQVLIHNIPGMVQHVGHVQ